MLRKGRIFGKGWYLYSDVWSDQANKYLSSDVAHA